MTYNNLYDLFKVVAEAVRPAERMSVSNAAEKYRYLNNPGSYIGPWDNRIAPYLTEVMDTFTSLDHTSVIFSGPARCGKALALDTRIPTPSGWTTMGLLKEGDVIYGGDGKPCNVTFVTDIQYDRDCYEFLLHDGRCIVADAEHNWLVRPQGEGTRYGWKIRKTIDLVESNQLWNIPACPSLKGNKAKLPVNPYKLGLGRGQDTYIPNIYLRASYEQRLALLQGLMDTDGYCDKRGRLEFSTSFQKIADGFSELLYSLGYRFCISKVGKVTRFGFSPKYNEKIFRLTRKQNRIKINEQSKIIQESTQIRSIERVSSVPVKCISVDSSDNTYLITDSMVVTHNTDLFFNWLLYTQVSDPADMMMIHMTQTTARDWSLRDLGKAFRHTPALGSLLMSGKKSHNVHDVRFKSGTDLLIAWPSITQLSAKTMPRLWLSDYDRMPHDIEGEGPPFDLAKKRSQTFGRYAMVVAESSPGYEVEDSDWNQTTAHEAPPTGGILSLYNRGDRRRYYWFCQSCGEPFEGDFRYLVYPDSDDKLEASEAVTMNCPFCNFAHTHEASDDGGDGKKALNLDGVWVKDGNIVKKDRKFYGTPVKSDSASFWLKGPAAAFMSWSDIVMRYLTSDGGIRQDGAGGFTQATTNVDQGLPFTPLRKRTERTPEMLKDRSKPYTPRTVHEGVRFLVASVDIQKSRFEVQIHGIGEGFDITIIDRFNIQYSERTDPDMKSQRLRVDPAAFIEDWDLLIDAVLKKTYPLDDESGRVMSIKAIGCDSGGRSGVTANAYNFWRNLRDDPSGDNLHRRFQLVKGVTRPNIPRVKKTYPESSTSTKYANARGEIPVLQINSNLIKDQAYGMLGRTEPKGGIVNFPAWLPMWFYSELTAEVKDRDQWKRKGERSNESWDLLCYCIAICLSDHINIENISWEDPPRWAAVHDENDLVFDPKIIDTPYEKPLNVNLAELGSFLL